MTAPCRGHRNHNWATARPGKMSWHRPKYKSSWAPADPRKHLPAAPHRPSQNSCHQNHRHRYHQPGRRQTGPPWQPTRPTQSQRPFPLSGSRSSDFEATTTDFRYYREPPSHALYNVHAATVITAPNTKQRSSRSSPPSRSLSLACVTPSPCRGGQVLLQINKTAASVPSCCRSQDRAGFCKREVNS